MRNFDEQFRRETTNIFTTSETNKNSSQIGKLFPIDWYFSPHLPSKIESIDHLEQKLLVQKVKLYIFMIMYEVPITVPVSIFKWSTFITVFK